MPSIPMMTDWETVAVPLVGGVDVTTRARLVSPSKLLVAENAYFPMNGGPEKRKGHTAVTVEDSRISPSGTPPTNHLYGYGLFDETSYDNGVVGTQSLIREAGPVLGVAKRDNEEICWDGWRLFSKDEFGFSIPWRNTTNYHGTVENSTCYLPTAVTTPIAKTQNSNAYSDCADNGVIRVVVFRDLANALTKVKCYDSVTGAIKFEGSADAGDPEYTRVVNCGAYIHVYVTDATQNTIYRHVIHQEDTQLSLGSEVTPTGDADNSYDVIKITEELLLLVYVKQATNTIYGTYFDASGTVNNTYFGANTAFDTTGRTGNITGVAVDVHPQTFEIGLIWKTSTPAQQARIYDAEGTALVAMYGLATNSDCGKVAICANYLKNQTSAGVFYCYMDNTLTTNRYIRVKTIASSSGSSQDYNIKFNMNLVGKPFRVGNVPFVFACFPSTYQTTYVLLDSHMTPSGKLEYGTAVNNTADPWMFAVNYVIAPNVWETTQFHCALMYNQRVLDQPGVFHETSTKFCELDFLPEFRYAQAGRCLYFPGAQLTCYDGERVAEAGFHFAIETPTLTPSNGAGALTNNGVYYYRIYQCHKNAQGEEVRGPAILTTSVTLGAADDTVTITGKSLPTCRDGTYFLIYRNANAGTLWYLASERDPSSANCPKNSMTGVTWSFTDLVSDATLITRELDPANAANYLQSYSAPPCEVISYGKNRLWLAGGELPPGTLLPSRLFGEAETPGFNLNLAYSVDRATDPVTAIAFVSDYLLAFKEKIGYIVSGDAADNVSAGDTLSSQLILSDVGCVSHNSTLRLSSGVAFQSEGGIRLVDASGNLRNIGVDVDSYVDYITGAVLDSVNRLAKFYQADGNTLVYDYENGNWTTWSVGTVSAVDDLLAVDNELWRVSDGYTDHDANYRFTVRSANYGPQFGGFSRVRRVLGIGESDANYRIRVRTYLDENTAHSEEWFWDSSDDLNTSTWGSGTWGSGSWGDSSQPADLVYGQDSVWRWRHRLAKQKCSCVSVEISYMGPGRGPVHTALVFEIGKKNGLDRRGH